MSEPSGIARLSKKRVPVEFFTPPPNNVPPKTGSQSQAFRFAIEAETSDLTLSAVLLALQFFLPIADIVQAWPLSAMILRAVYCLGFFICEGYITVFLNANPIIREQYFLGQAVWIILSSFVSAALRSGPCFAVGQSREWGLDDVPVISSYLQQCLRLPSSHITYNTISFVILAILTVYCTIVWFRLFRRNQRYISYPLERYYNTIHNKPQVGALQAFFCCFSRRLDPHFDEYRDPYPQGLCHRTKKWSKINQEYWKPPTRAPKRGSQTAAVRYILEVPTMPIIASIIFNFSPLAVTAVYLPFEPRIGLMIRGGYALVFLGLEMYISYGLHGNPIIRATWLYKNAFLAILPATVHQATRFFFCNNNLQAVTTLDNQFRFLLSQRQTSTGNFTGLASVQTTMIQRVSTNDTQPIYSWLSLRCPSAAVFLPTNDTSTASVITPDSPVARDRLYSSLSLTILIALLAWISVTYILMILWRLVNIKDPLIEYLIGAYPGGGRELSMSSDTKGMLSREWTSSSMDDTAGWVIDEPNGPMSPRSSTPLSQRHTRFASPTPSGQSGNTKLQKFRPLTGSADRQNYERIELGLYPLGSSLTNSQNSSPLRQSFR